MCNEKGFYFVYKMFAYRGITFGKLVKADEYSRLKLELFVKLTGTVS